jgi:hypothetical protein
MHGDDADQVVRVLDDDGAEAAALGDDVAMFWMIAFLFTAERQGVDAFLGDDDELHRLMAYVPSRRIGSADRVGRRFSGSLPHPESRGQ